MKLYTLLVCVVYALCNEPVHGDDGRRLQLKVLRHQPCTKGTPYEKIRFPDINDAPLQPDPSRGDGCYTIRGSVRVLQRIDGVVQLYVETKYGTKAPVEQCRGADKNNCGGAGSCIYCNACEGIRQLGRSAVQLAIGNKRFDCKKGLAPRNYTDIKISFCMPTKQEFLKSQNIDEDFWNRYGASGQMIFLTLYVFNRQVNTISRRELVKIAAPDSDQIIGCHKLVGSVYEANPSS